MSRPKGSKNRKTLLQPKPVAKDDTAFQANPRLKKVGIQISLDQNQLDEYLKCAEDPIYFIETYVKFMTLDEGLTNIKLYPFQKKMIEAYHNNRMIIMKTGRQFGKALALDTPIPTPTGWKTMGDLKTGDYVFGQNGAPVRIIYTTETMYNHDCFKITFDNGETITADAEHLWTVSSYTGKEVLETQQLYQRLPKYKSKGQGISITKQEPIKYPNQITPLPIDPYILGLWLGDGDSAGGQFTCADYDWPLYEKYIKKIGYTLTDRGFRLAKSPANTKAGYFTIQGLTTKLRQLNLLHNKHIPEIYKRASISDRRALIRGLMDSDGVCDLNKQGHPSAYFSQKIGRLFDDTNEILCSLGIKTRIRIDKTNTYGIIACNTLSFDLFTIPRKLNRQYLLQGNYQIQNYYIKSIEPTNSVPVRCIQIDSSDHLFLCGRSMIPTHNSQATISYLLHYVLFNKDKTIGILAQKQKVAIELLTRLKVALEYIPLWMQQGIVSWNQTMIELENGSRIISESTSTGAIRGFTINLLYLDEFAHVPTHVAEDFFTSVFPTISSGKTSKIIITSTPFGLNLFYKFWNDAIKKDNDPLNWNGFEAIDVSWKDVPGRTEEWLQQQRKVLGDRKFSQDVLAEFLGSSNTLILGKKLRELVFVQPSESLFDEAMSIYERPKQNHSYALSGDASEGKGLDYAAFTVFDITEAPYRVVAKFRDNKTEDIMFASYIQQVAKHYNEAYVIIENNDIGALVLHHLIYELDYDNCFYSFTNEHAELTVEQQGHAKVPGIKTSSKVKTQGCLKLKTIIENDQLIINDFDIVSELSTFVLQKNRRYAAEDGYSDDLCSCLWLFAWLTIQPFFKDISDLGLRQRLFAERERQTQELMPPVPVFESLNYKKPKLEIDPEGTLWLDSAMSLEEALNILNDKD